MSISLSAVGNGVKVPLFLFKVEGGPLRSFINGLGLENNCLVMDEFEDAKNFKNLTIGRERDKYSMEFVGLSKLQDELVLASLFVECHSKNSKAKTFFQLNMEYVKVFWSGKSDNKVDKFKLIFKQANAIFH